MADETVAEAKARRIDEAVNRVIDAHIDTRLAKVQLAAPIAPPARVKLRNILKYYAKQPHPFRACVKDNMKRFGPGRTEAVCATLKDTIRGRKDWRGKNNPKDKGTAGLSDDAPTVDGDVLVALNAISETDLQQIFMEARALEEYGNSDSVALLSTTGRQELESWGVDGAVGLSITRAIQEASA